MSDTANTNQHYVPQMLLRGFSISSAEEQVRVFDKSSGKEFVTAIRNIGAEHGYYDLNGSAEIDAAMNQMDDLAAPVMHKLRNCRSLSGIDTIDRFVLASFTVMQMLRTRGFQEQMRYTEEIISEAIESRTGGLPPGWPQTVDPAEARERYLKIIPQFGLAFLPQLLNKNLLLYRTTRSHPFIVSDHPVTLNNTINPGNGIRGTLGLGVPGIEIYLPISGELTLAYMCRSIGEAYETIASHLKSIGGFLSEDAYYYIQARDMGRALMLEPTNVQFQNSLQTLNAERFLISSVSNFDDALEIIKAHPEAKCGRRLKVM